MPDGAFKSRDYRLGAEKANAYFFDIHTRVEKAAKAGADRILAKMRERPDEPICAYFTKAGVADSEVLAVARGEPVPPDACLVTDEAIERVPAEYLYGFLFQRLRALPMLASGAKH